MKTPLFLVLAGASFALCNCQQQQTSSSVATVPAPPIKVVAEKNEITPVTIGSGLAPASVKGKTFVFNFSNAVSRHGELDDGNMKYGAPSKVTAGTESVRVNGNSKNTYSKTGSTTAKVEVNDPMSYVAYELTFTSATSGTASKITSYGEQEDRVTGITFTIK